MESQSGMSFQKIVIIVAVVLLVITLTVIGYMLKEAIQSQPLIKNLQLCPDLWTRNGDDCQSAKNANDNTYPNAGNFIISVVNCDKGVMGAPSGSTEADTCFGTGKVYDSAQWVQGNDSNGLDPEKIYLLASALLESPSSQKIGSSKLNALPTDITYTPASYEANQKWAKAYNISWDGVN